MANGEELIQQHRIPMDKTYSYKTVNGSSVVYMGSKNFPKNIEALHEFIYGEYIPVTVTDTLWVFDRTYMGETVRVSIDLANLAYSIN